MADRQTEELHQENRTLRLWFYEQTENECLSDAHKFIRSVFKSDEFPRGRSWPNLWLTSLSLSVTRLFLVHQTTNGTTAHVLTDPQNRIGDPNVERR